MWHHICEQIGLSTGLPFHCDKPKHLNIDCSNQAFLLADNQRQFFVKLSDKGALNHFESEVIGLEHLRQAKQFHIPKVISCGTVTHKSYLALEYLTFIQPSDQTWHQAGQMLAAIHQYQPQQMHGWQEDNYIGQTVQPNQWHKRWATFFAEQRIGYQLQLLAEKGHSMGDIDHIVSKVKELLRGHCPAPSLLHGDLWQGNIAFTRQGPCLFDAACYYGDRETDLAMSELFGQFPGSFYQGYNQTWIIEGDYEYRKPVYQLYHLLNHALLFGGHYFSAAQNTLQNIDV